MTAPSPIQVLTDALAGAKVELAHREAELARTKRAHADAQEKLQIASRLVVSLNQAHADLSRLMELCEHGFNEAHVIPEGPNGKLAYHCGGGRLHAALEREQARACKHGFEISHGTCPGPGFPITITE